MWRVIILHGIPMRVKQMGSCSMPSARGSNVIRWRVGGWCNKAGAGLPFPLRGLSGILYKEGDSNANAEDLIIFRRAEGSRTNKRSCLIYYGAWPEATIKTPD